MVRPCWVGEVDETLRLCVVEFGEKEGTEMNGTGSGDGLQAGDLGGSCELKS